MGKTKTKRRRRSAAARPVQAPKRRERPQRLPAWAYALGGTLVVALFAGGALLLAREQAGSRSDGPAAAAGGLPNTSDYHSLLVARNDPRHLMLGRTPDCTNRSTADEAGSKSRSRARTR
jgi:hypothetical protein